MAKRGSSGCIDAFLPKPVKQVKPSPQPREEALSRPELQRRKALAIRAIRAGEEERSEGGGKGKVEDIRTESHSQEPSVVDLLTELSWREALRGTLDGPPGEQVDRLLKREAEAGVKVYPPEGQIFRAMNELPMERVKAVIIGQDPYHGEGQAEGFSFSVPKSQPIPSSLKNILKELNQDVGAPIPPHGHLGKWVQEGVLLLNAVLTVQAGKPKSHQKKGWEAITKQAIRQLCSQRESVAFLLWGRDAQEKKSCIDTSKHLVLEAAHPSGLSAHRGFFGCRHFSRANRFLEDSGQSPIDWTIP